MELLMILAWVVLGVISVYVTAMIHFIAAYKRGYDVINWWKKEGKTLIKNTKYVELRLIWGLIAWPIKISDFILETVPYLYEQYDLRT